jgi:hypothetical protein
MNGLGSFRFFIDLFDSDQDNNLSISVKTKFYNWLYLYFISKRKSNENGQTQSLPPNVHIGISSFLRAKGNFGIKEPSQHHIYHVR